MGPQTRMGVLLLLTTVLPCAEGALRLYDPKLCYILDGFLMLYGLIITGMFIREKFFRFKSNPADDATYTDLKPKSTEGGYEFLKRDAERGMPRRDRRAGGDDDHYQSLTPRPQGEEYKELPVKKERRRNKNEQVYQGLSTATKDTYDSLQMQPLVHPR